MSTGFGFWCESADQPQVVFTDELKTTANQNRPLTKYCSALALVQYKDFTAVENSVEHVKCQDDTTTFTVHVDVKCFHNWTAGTQFT